MWTWNPCEHAAFLSCLQTSDAWRRDGVSENCPLKALLLLPPSYEWRALVQLTSCGWDAQLPGSPSCSLWLRGFLQKTLPLTPTSLILYSLSWAHLGNKEVSVVLRTALDLCCYHVFIWPEFSRSRVDFWSVRDAVIAARHGIGGLNNRIFYRCSEG